MATETYDVILVDDEPSLTAIFTHMTQIKYNTWRTQAYNNSQELYEQITSGAVTARVWIVDIMMPGKNGIEITKAIRSTGDATELVIGYTALEPETLSKSAEYREGLQLFDRVSSKQESVMHLLATVNALIQQTAR